MRQLKTRIVSTLARLYLRRSGNTGFDLSKVGKLPKKTLLPLRRVGLDPVPELRQARAKGSIIPLSAPLGLPVWLVTGYETAKIVLADSDGFSTDFANLAGTASGAVTSPGGLGFADPPEHTRLRKLLTPEFTMRRMARLTPRIHDIVAERLDAMAASPGPVDLVAEFALPIPSLVICELLGVPYTDRDSFQALAMARFDVVGSANDSLGAIGESLEYLKGVVAAQRKEPGDGLVGMILREHGDEVTDEELAGLADGVLTGGFETTASMLALGALVLLQNAEARDRVREDDSVITPLVEELLRHLTVVQVAFPRFARRDLTVAGAEIRKGDVVIVSLSGANRDPELAEGLETIDHTRKALSHLAFGHGLHRCVGAELARMELRAAYPALVRRFPNMTLAVDPGKLQFRKASIVYGLEHLPVYLHGHPTTR